MVWWITLPNPMARTAHEDQIVWIVEALVIAKVVSVTSGIAADVTLATMPFVDEFSCSLPFFRVVKVSPLHILFMHWSFILRFL